MHEAGRGLALQLGVTRHKHKETLAYHLDVFYSRACVQILICQNLRNNLQHPNEYIRGVTLRFLCRIREEEILEPLIPSILACLEHRHSYVRRNAVLAINALYRLPRGELLLQDAPELIEKVQPCFSPLP